MKVCLFIIVIFYIWILNKQDQVSCQMKNRNFKNETYNEKWIPRQRTTVNANYQRYHYPKHNKRQNDEQMTNNAPLAGMEEALFLRHHYFREKDNQEGRRAPNREYNKVDLRAHRRKIMNVHRVVPHHLEHVEPKFNRPEGYEGYKSYKRNNNPDEEITTTRSGVRGRFQNLGHQIRHFFARNQSRDATAYAKSRNYPKHRKRSEFELIPEWETKRKPSIAYEMMPHRIEENEFVNRFIMPRIAQLSLQEKSSKIFDKNFHIICETDEETQQIQCRNTETNVIHKAEDSVMHSNPNSKTNILKMQAERNNQLPNIDDYIEQI